MGKSLSDIGNLISSIARPGYLKEVIAGIRILPDKLDDAFEGMTDDDAFIDGWFAVRKIKGRHKPKDKSEKKSAENS